MHQRHHLPTVKSSFFTTLLLILGLQFNVAAFADTGDTELEELVPTKEHREATEIIVYYMQHYHYSTVAVDDELSDQIFERFLDSLDPQKSIFLASDIKEFDEYRLKLDNALKDANLDPVFDVFKRFRSRMEERVVFAKDLLTKEFDFTIDESYTFDREDASWPESKMAADELWRKRVKNDVLNLRLADQPNDELVSTLSERYERMERRIMQLSANDVFQIFINAYTLSVEPHTSYFSPRSSEDFAISMSLSLEGIGAALRTEGEYTVVQRVITGGPAALSEQVTAEDRIIGVGQGEDEEFVDVVSWPLGDVVDLIRGPKGSTMRLKILAAEAAEGAPPKLVTLVRDEIKLEEQAAKSALVEPNTMGSKQRFGVIELPTFYLDGAAKAQGKKDYRSTTRDVKNLINELADTEGGIDGIIVDLRGNGGGSLSEAIELTGLFIETGPVVQIRNSDGEVRSNKDEDPEIAYSGPLAVLVDRNSASASEIFAAAIQDYGRGIIIGEPTFGKGTVQTVAPLDRAGELGQLKITMAQFFRINGDGTQFRGVVPDILFPTAMDSDAQGERGLDNALPWYEVAAVSYDAWSMEKQDYSTLQSLHEARYKASDSFSLLIEELESQRTFRAQQSVSLLESVRKKEFSENREGREERVELFRKAFGSSNTDDDEEGPADILLEEAANVLSDKISAVVVKR